MARPYHRPAPRRRTRLASGQPQRGGSAGGEASQQPLAPQVLWGWSRAGAAVSRRGRLRCRRPPGAGAGRRAGGPSRGQVALQLGLVQRLALEGLPVLDGCLVAGLLAQLEVALQLGLVPAALRRALPSLSSRRLAGLCGRSRSLGRASPRRRCQRLRGRRR
jgi:hypothetical protein